MAYPPDRELQRYLGNLPIKLKRQLATAIKAEADKLADKIKFNGPRGKTGNLAASVKVRRKKNDLDLEVTAGGDLTTKYYDRSTGYQKKVVVDGRDNRGIAKKAGGAGVSYDYVLAKEFGTLKQSAEPFFYPTYRAYRDDIRQNIQKAVEDVLK